jgi:hypothetical protein
MQMKPAPWPLFFAALSACATSRTDNPALSDVSSEVASIFQQIHYRYVGKRVTHVTFLQKTQAPDASVELWYEAIRPPGLVRVDKAPLEERRGFIYRADSLYTFEAGRIVEAKGDERWITMLALVDIYSLPVDGTLQRLRSLGVDLGALHETRWNGRPVIIVGTQAGDTASAQIWYDREDLYPVRVIQPPGGSHPRVDFQISGHRFLEGGWIETEIRIFVGGRLVSTECYGEIRPHSDLADGLFDPQNFMTRQWAEVAYPYVRTPPGCDA